MRPIAEPLILSVSGPDRPGILAQMASALDAAGIEIVDIEQATLQDFLALSFLLDLGEDAERVGVKLGAALHGHNAAWLQTFRNLCKDTVEERVPLDTRDRLRKHCQVVDDRVELTRFPRPGGEIQKIGRLNGLSAEQLGACLSDQDYAKALIEAYKENSTADDVSSTPTFLINGEKHPGNMPFEEIAALVDAQL